MGLKWTDVNELGIELADTYPDVDPLSLSFVKLRELVMALPEFDDDPNRSGEKILEGIQMAWLEERD